MRYFVEDIEDQLIATLKAAPGVTDAVQIDVNTEVRPALFTQQSYIDNVLPKPPFIFIEYRGKSTDDKSRDTAGQVYEHTLRFRFYIGGQSLRSKKDIQRQNWGAYQLLRLVYDNIHGKQPLPETLSSVIPNLSGVDSTATEFNCLSPFLEAGGTDETILVNLPSILVYATDYTVRLLA